MRGRGAALGDAGGGRVLAAGGAQSALSSRPTCWARRCMRRTCPTRPRGRRSAQPTARRARALLVRAPSSLVARRPHVVARPRARLYTPDVVARYLA